MNIHHGMLVAAAVACSISVTPAFAKTAKECTAEWRADKVGMQARGVTEKSYVDQCKGGGEPAAAAPAPKPAEMAPPRAPRQATATGSKTAKDCTAEWRADKAGMQARGVTEKGYVEQCKGGSAPAASGPPPTPTAATPPAPVAPPTSTPSSQKTAKDCIAEWRADKAGMQARGVTEKTYVELCKAGGVAPSAAAPDSKQTAPTPVPAPKQASPATPPPQAQSTQKPAPTTSAAPAPAPAQQSPASTGGATLEAGQFVDEASAKARCPSDTVVWVNLPSKIYHFAGTKSYGTTKRGAYMCEKEAIASENRVSKTEKHP
jgi:hypothetical protein